MIPRNIETTDQWQIRWVTHTGAEITRTGTEVQMRSLYERRKADFLSPVLEKRTITVGPWVDPDSNVLEVDDDEDE